MYKKPNGGSIMKNKLFLSLSLLTAAFTIASPETNDVTDEMLKDEANKVAHEAFIANYNANVAETNAINAKNAADAADAAAINAKAIADYLAKPESTKFENFKAMLDEKRALTIIHMLNAYKALGTAGSCVTTNVKAHPYIYSGVGLAAVAGVSYLAFSKVRKAQAAKKSHLAKIQADKKAAQLAAAQAAVVAPVKKAKRHFRRK